MKKYLYAAALSVLIIACTKEQVATDCPLQNISFTIEAPGAPATKAYGDAEKATVLYYQVFDNDGKVIKDLGVQKTTLSEKKAKVNFQLVKDQTYNFVFWAQTKFSDYYTIDATEGLKKITANYSKKGTANNENFDAFFATETMTITGPVSKTITLKRPFAQINIASSDIIKAGDVDVHVDLSKSQSTVTIKQIPTVFSPLADADKQLSGETDVTFKKASLPLDSLTIAGKEYKHIAFSYVFAPEEGTVYDLESTLIIDKNNTDKTVTIKVPSTPAKRNWRTNIYGTLLTATADFNVVVEPGFETPDTDVEVRLVKDKNAFVEALNAGAKSIELVSDINLDGEALTLDHDVTIVGNDHKFSSSAEELINITSGANIILRGVDLTSTNKNCVNISNTASGATVLFEDSKLSADFYGINVNSGCENIEVNLTNSTVDGWASINCYANNSKFNIDGCTLKGINTGKPEGKTNDFATIVFDGGAIRGDVAVGTYGSNNNVTIKNSNIIAKSETSNRQLWLSCQYGANNNTITYSKSTTTITDGNGVDKSNDYSYSTGTSHSIITVK